MLVTSWFKNLSDSNKQKNADYWVRKSVDAEYSPPPTNQLFSL